MCNIDAFILMVNIKTYKSLSNNENEIITFADCYHNGRMF